MKVAVLGYATASRTYLVEIPDDTEPGIATTVAVTKTDTGTWAHMSDWDQDADFGSNMDPVAIFALTPDGDSSERIDEVEE